MITFQVFGVPKPGGSKRGIVHRQTGRVVLIDMSKNKEWRADVSAAALGAMGEREPLEGPLSLRVMFLLRRPKGHYRTGKRSNEIKPGQPLHPATKPDATKLLRSTEDALTGILWRDDAQIVTQHVEKRYVGPDDAVGAIITVSKEH